MFMYLLNFPMFQIVTTCLFCALSVYLIDLCSGGHNGEDK